jgi:hypothetical protein
MQTGQREMKNNVTLTMSSVSGVLAADEVPAIIFERTKCEKSLQGAKNLTRVRQALWGAAGIFQGFAWIFAVLYLVGAVAFGVALLFYTFTR